MKKVGRLYRECLVEQLKGGVAGNDNVFLLSYSRVSGLQMGDLRKNLKQTGADVCAAKNSVARLALKEMEYEELADKISGQTALVWGGADSVEVSKILFKCAEESENIVVRGGLLQGRVLGQDDVKKLSELPPREVLLAALLSVIQSPLTRLAGALNAKTRDLLSILKQLSEKKGGNENV
jgi:large subunit ribosomal protein L10